ncbi:hypothetical protein ElyMa_002035300 [Elysia marginata]|uniref:Uncharacterized protein n=1 Tax=Elysia marginata TaxID=1093978 RepID=A0AAV4F6F9_9GAST|nr:hypothetical protein ElyMa_002035300 [Elysia marginata]
MATYNSISMEVGGKGGKTCNKSRIATSRAIDVLCLSWCSQGFSLDQSNEELTLLTDPVAEATRTQGSGHRSGRLAGLEDVLSFSTQVPQWWVIVYKFLSPLATGRID